MIVVSLLLAGCGLTDVGAFAGTQFTENVAASGFESAAAVGLRAGADLHRCIDLPTRVEVQGRVESGAGGRSGDVRVDTFVASVPILVGMSWPDRSDGNGFELTALLGPELRYEVLRTRIVGDTTRDGFARLAFLAQPGFAYRYAGTRLGALGIVRFGDTFDFGAILAVDIML
ncbi:MAG: hypothetical protein AAF654_09615 [Myxococcota bacterium]